jgi:hypothetical protein
MNVRYENMTDEQRVRCDEAMEKYTEWLNRHKDEVDEEDVTREMYFEWDDPPILLVDETAGYHIGSMRVMAFSLTPFHDEGGHAMLTLFYRNYGVELSLESIVHEFDTGYSILWQNGKFE